MRRLGRVLLLVGALATAVAFGAMSFLDRLIFQPGFGTPGTAEGVETEDVFLQTDDGVRVHAYWLEAGAGIDRAILFLHGNAGDASHRLPRASRLRELGAHVLLLDYRGYGRSDGRPSEAGVYSDARAALGYLATERSIPRSRTIVFGRSLGGAVAVDAAQDLPLAGLVLESTFPSVADIARSYLGIGFDAWLGSRLASIEKAAAIRCPVLAFHGSLDRVIPIALGRKLFEAMPEPKEWHEIPGWRHNVTPYSERYWEAWRNFLARVAPLETPAAGGTPR